MNTLTETMQFDIHFTLEEVRAQLPEVRQALLESQDLLRHIEGLRGEVRSMLEKAHNGGGPAALRYFNLHRRFQVLLRDLLDRGIIIQDIVRGLIDFPHIRNGREVLLCYELADGDSIRFWHELDAGFRGRRPL